MHVCCIGRVSDMASGINMRISKETCSKKWWGNFTAALYERGGSRTVTKGLD